MSTKKPSRKRVNDLIGLVYVFDGDEVPSQEELHAEFIAALDRQREEVKKDGPPRFWQDSYVDDRHMVVQPITRLETNAEYKKRVRQLGRKKKFEYES